METLEKKGKGSALLPFLLFIVIYLGAGLYFQAQGVEMAFYQFPSVTAMFIALLLAFCQGKGTIDQKFTVFAKGAANENVLTMLMIYILAGAFSTVASAMGGVEATVNLGLSVIPVHFLAAGVFVISAFMGTATGTSMGTISAIVPIAVGVAEKGGLSLPLFLGACVGGAMFGDNLSMISDTTIAATKTQGCEMKDKFRTNFLIVLPAAIINIVILLVITMNANYAVSGDLSYNFLQVVPYLVVLIGALIGFNVFAVLGVGTILSIAVGLYTGTIPVNEIFTSMGSGVTNMYDITVISIVVCAISALMKAGGGIQAILDLIRRRVKSRRGAMLGIGVLCAGVDVATANNTISIVMTGELARDISQEYGIDPKQTASLLDICTSVVQGLLPYGAQLLYASAATKEQVSSFAIVPYCFYPMLMAVCVVGYILFSKKTK